MKVKVDKQGRFVIPAPLREQLGIRPGEVLTLTVEEGELRARSVAAGIKKAQQIAAKYTQGRTGIVDEFLADRRREAERE